MPIFQALGRLALGQIPADRTPAASLPYNQTYWPLVPAARQPAPSLTVTFNPNLRGQDRLPFRQMHWPLPAQPYRQPQLVTWFDPLRLLLLVPFRQSDWPLAPGPRQPDRSFLAVFPRVLIGQDRLPTGKIIYDRPTLSRAQALSWIQSVNLLLAQPTPFAQRDWPVPLGARQPAPGLTASYNPNLIGQDRLPNRQQDWPNPRAAHRSPSLSSWISSVSRVLVAQSPFSQTQWPNPQRRVPSAQTWANSLNLALITPVAAARPFSQTSWPLTARQGQLPTGWILSTNPLLLRPIPPLPYNQYHWPLPERPPLLLQQSVFWEASLFQPPWVPPPTPPVGQGRRIVAGSEWQQYDRMRDWPGPVGWR